MNPIVEHSKQSGLAQPGELETTQVHYYTKKIGLEETDYTVEHQYEIKKEGRDSFISHTLSITDNTSNITSITKVITKCPNSLNKKQMINFIKEDNFQLFINTNNQLEKIAPGDLSSFSLNKEDFKGRHITLIDTTILQSEAEAEEAAEQKEPSASTLRSAGGSTLSRKPIEGTLREELEIPTYYQRSGEGIEYRIHHEYDSIKQEDKTTSYFHTLYVVHPYTNEEQKISLVTTLSNKKEALPILKKINDSIQKEMKNHLKTITEEGFHSLKIDEIDEDEKVLPHTQEDKKGETGPLPYINFDALDNFLLKLERGNAKSGLSEGLQKTKTISKRNMATLSRHTGRKMAQQMKEEAVKVPAGVKKRQKMGTKIVKELEKKYDLNNFAENMFKGRLNDLLVKIQAKERQFLEPRIGEEELKAKLQQFQEEGILPPDLSLPSPFTNKPVEKFILKLLTYSCKEDIYRAKLQQLENNIGSTSTHLSKEGTAKSQELENNIDSTSTQLSVKDVESLRALNKIHEEQLRFLMLYRPETTPQELFAHYKVTDEIINKYSNRQQWQKLKVSDPAYGEAVRFAYVVESIVCDEMEYVQSSNQKDMKKYGIDADALKPEQAQVLAECSVLMEKGTIPPYMIVRPTLKNLAYCYTFELILRHKIDEKLESYYGGG